MPPAPPPSPPIAPPAPPPEPVYVLDLLYVTFGGRPGSGDAPSEHVLAEELHRPRVRGPVLEEELAQVRRLRTLRRPFSASAGWLRLR